MLFIPRRRVYWVYIMANRYNSVYYIGMMNNIRRRMWEHRTRRNPRSFTARYNIHKLLYTERFPTPWQAICREKRLKRWKRRWKDALIEEQNPEYADLLPDLYPSR